jgi:hypothetical protein
VIFWFQAFAVNFNLCRYAEVLVGGSETSQLKTALEDMRVDNALAEEALEKAAKSAADTVKEGAASTMAIANLFKRCKQVSRGGGCTS